MSGQMQLFDIIVLALLSAGAAYAWISTRWATVNVGVQLRNGPKYSQKLDPMVERSDFFSPHGRLATLNRVVRMIDLDDVVDGLVGISGLSSGKESAGRYAERLARSQMKRIGIQPQVVNVARPDGHSTHSVPTGDSAACAGGDACILAVAITLRRKAARRLRSGMIDEIRHTLDSLARISERDLDAFYLYYCPHSGEPLDVMSASRMFLDLREAGR